MFKIIKIAPRGDDKWENYNVSEADDLKRAEIAVLADLEGRSAQAAIASFLITILALCAQREPRVYVPWDQLSVLHVFAIGALFSTLFFCVAFTFYHLRRVKTIASISSDSARLQIRHILSFRADADVYMVGEMGVSLPGSTK
jgi:hypothetical protein